MGRVRAGREIELPRPISSLDVGHLELSRPGRVFLNMENRKQKAVSRSVWSGMVGIARDYSGLVRNGRAKGKRK